MRSDKYWAARAAKRMDYAMKDAQEISNRIGRAYNEALRDIQSQLDSIFRNFSAGISQAEAVRILNQVSIGRSSSVTDMLKQALDLVADPEDRAKLLAEINAPAYKYRMQRLKELAEDAGKKCAEIARTTRSELDGGLAEIVRDSYFRGIFDMQQGTGLAFSFSKISDRQVREILSQDWSGAHYSKRIWQNTNALAGELQNTLLKGVLTGASGGRMANEIQQRFHASYSRALTLTRTESSHCANSAELRRYEETGVKKYRYVATLDSHTSDICQELDGQEFPVEDASPGTNYPPMHPRCRSTTIAAISRELMQKLERRARDPETGKLRTVPADMTYREWYGKYVEGGELTGREKSGIIKAEEVKGLEQAKKRDHKIVITDNAIEHVDRIKPSDFSDRQADEMQQMHKKLLKTAKEENDSNEVLFITGLDFSSEVAVKGGEFKVSPATNPFAVSVIAHAKRQSLLYLHNHPSTNTFSVGDIDTFCCEKAIKLMSVVTNQGEVYILNKTVNYSFEATRELLTSIFESFPEGEIDDKIFVKKFLKECHKGGVEYAKAK